MKTFLSIALALGIASTSAQGWLIEKPVDYAKQLREADFAGVVEVAGIVESGHKKVLYEGGVAFRGLTLELKVLSPLKGKGSTVKCVIHRERTREELLADGIAGDDVWRILLNLATDETLHHYPARVAKGDRLLVYLRSDGSNHFPVAGPLNSSHSLLSLKPSNLVNTLVRAPETAAAPVPGSKD